MSWRSSDVRAVLYLQRRIIFNWLRRTMRSPFFWLIGAFILFVVVSQIGAVITGPDESPMGINPDPTYFNAIAAITLFVAILIGFWRGTTNTPGASLADVVLLMRSPVSRRLQFGLLMARPSLTNALIIGLWSVAAGGGIILGIDDEWMSLRLVFSVMIVILLSELLRNAVWVGTEQVVARSPESGNRLRFLIRGTVLMIATAAGATIAWPVTQQSAGDWQDVLTLLIERGESLATVPPMSFAASVFNPEGQSVLGALALMALTAGVVVLALYWARDFTEPVAVMAERKTDPRGQMLEAGSDVQWAALAQFGVSPRLRTTVTPFGRGPWALLWGGLTRWVRYQIAAAWITVFVLGLFGVLAGIAVRLGLVPVVLAWAIALMFPFFGSVNMFLDELRRQFIFLIPGTTWQKITAGAIPSVLDGLVASLVAIVAMTALGAIPVSHAFGLACIGFAISLLGQACLAFVQVLLPFWTGQRIRVSLTFFATAVAFIPGLLALSLLTIAGNPFTGMIVSAAITVIIGLIVLAIAATRFDQIEYSG
jgi:hypothetical protein